MFADSDPGLPSIHRPNHYFLYHVGDYICTVQNHVKTDQGVPACYGAVVNSPW